MVAEKNAKKINGAAQENAGQNFGIQKIYTKGVSFESPNAVKAFQLQDWNPQVDLDLRTSTNLVEGDVHEVVLTLTATAKIEKDQTVFLVEVQQAGLFVLSGFPKEQLEHMLGAYCPNVLFPYGRQVVSDLIIQGGFPPLYLAPINFDALYQQHLTEQKTEA